MLVNPVRNDGSRRTLSFSDHGMERLRGRLPPGHAAQGHTNGQLADLAERAVTDNTRYTPAKRVINGGAVQWEVDVPL